jgi:hypothetical protein
MNTLSGRFTALAVSSLLLPLVIGCAGRTAPFNEMDEAQFTVYKLQGQEPPPAAAPTPASPMGGIQIPGLPPELQAGAQQLGQQLGAGISQLCPTCPPIPGLTGGQPGAPVAPAQPPPPRFKGFIILAQMPLSDQAVKDEVLDVFGSEDSFQAQHNNCFFPGLGVSMNRQGQAPVDLLVSLSCNQAQGDGFRWPYKVNGLAPEASQKLTKVYEKLWGPVPPAS